MSKQRTIWTVLSLGVLAAGSLLAFSLLRPRSEEDGVVTSPAALDAGAVATTPRRCSCGGDCGGLAMLIPDRNLTDPTRVASGADYPGATYCCSLHPRVLSSMPGTCPVCQMPLSRNQAAKNPPGVCTCQSCPMARHGRVMAN